LLGIAFLIATGLLNYTVPVFDDLYSNFGADLPVLTQFFIAFGEYSIFILIAFIILLGLSIWGWYRIAFNLPLLGKLYHLTAIAHFLHTTGFILQHGGTMQQALKGTGDSMSHNRHYSQTLLQASQEINSGKSSAEVLKASKLFPQKVIHALHVGENRPHFANLLLQLAAVYRLKANQSFEPRLRLFGFIMLILVGLFIGTLVIAMYLPIFKMGTTI
jgi:type IV pilus assembly protein PilC